MIRPVRATLIYGLISALTIMPATWMLAVPVGWPMAFKLVLWMDLFVYAVLLTRWSGKGPGALLFPLALLLGFAFWPGVYVGFFYLGLGIFSWIRSGICFTGAPLRAIMAEIITVAGGAGLLALFPPGSTITWAIAIWLFFLVQALYFLIIPQADRSHDVRPVADPFEEAYREAQRVLDGG